VIIKKGTSKKNASFPNSLRKKEFWFLVYQSYWNSPMDPIAPSITFFDKEGKGRVNYIGNLVPEKVFYPTPGLWFSNQNDEVCSLFLNTKSSEAM
jgi:hypothetical protein